MIKDLIVNLAIGAERDPARDYALQARGITVAFARVRDVVRDDMRLAGIEAIVGSSNFYERITDGVRACSSKSGARLT